MFDWYVYIIPCKCLILNELKHQNPLFQLLNALRVFFNLALNEIIAVFAVAETVAARNVVVVFERRKDVFVVFQILLVLSKKPLQVVQVRIETFSR